MAEKIFTIDNPANPIRLVKIEDYDPGKYFYRSFDRTLSFDLIPDFQKKECYFQKWTIQDKPVLQMLSDYEEIYCRLFDINTGIEVQDFEIIEVPSNILNETFKCYQVEIDYSLVGEGEYELQISYINDLIQEVIYYSEPQEIKEVHENTVLIEYRNSENDFSMILGDTFSGILRVEAAILNFKPASDDVIYNDQKRESTTLYSLPYRIYQFVIGSAKGLPDWMVDKVNRTFSFNILSLDGVYYNKIEGAKFEESRTEDYPFSGQKIDIMPVENGFLKKLNTTSLIPEDEDMIPYQKVLKYIANGDDIEIPGIFKNGTVLEKIFIINRSIDFTLNIATESTGGDDDLDLSADVQGLTFSLIIDQLFSETKNINITGLSGGDTDVYVVYKDLLAKPAGTPNGYIMLGIGAVVIYEEQNVGDYDIDFNFATGLGREGTQWDGWAICDGRNGTKDRGGVYPIGFKEETGGLFTKLLLGTTGGTWLINLLVGNLPKFRVKLFGNTLAPPGTPIDPNKAIARAGTGSSALAYEMRESASEATLGQSSETGNNESYDHKSPYIVSLYVKKITEVA